MLTPDTTKLMIFTPKSTQIRKMKKSSGLETPPRLFLTMAQTCSLPKNAGNDTKNLIGSPKLISPSKIKELDVNYTSFA